MKPLLAMLVLVSTVALAQEPAFDIDKVDVKTLQEWWKGEDLEVPTPEGLFGDAYAVAIVGKVFGMTGNSQNTYLSVFKSPEGLKYGFLPQAKELWPKPELFPHSFFIWPPFEEMVQHPSYKAHPVAASDGKSLVEVFPHISNTTYELRKKGALYLSRVVQPQYKKEGFGVFYKKVSVKDNAEFLDFIFEDPYGREPLGVSTLFEKGDVFARPLRCFYHSKGWSNKSVLAVALGIRTPECVRVFGIANTKYEPENVLRLVFGTPEYILEKIQAMEWLGEVQMSTGAENTVLTDFTHNGKQRRFEFRQFEMGRTKPALFMRIVDAESPTVFWSCASTKLSADSNPYAEKKKQPPVQYFAADDEETYTFSPRINPGVPRDGSVTPYYISPAGTPRINLHYPYNNGGLR